MRPYTGRGKAGHMAAQQEGTGFIYGKNAVAELLKSGTGADTVYIQDTMAPREAAYYTPPPGSRPFWCCATAWRTLTTWAPLCARRFCAARTAW